MPLEPGATLGPYVIRAELGHGGMGVVYTAHDPRLDRQVAIKVLPPDLARDDTAKQRFLQEAQAAAPSCPRATLLARVVRRWDPSDRALSLIRGRHDQGNQR